MTISTTQLQLNWLADNRVACTIKNASFGWAVIQRYEPLLESILISYTEQIGGDGKAAQRKLDKWVGDGGCYVFEIGKNCGDVFSANMVKSIETASTGAVITLK